MNALLTYVTESDFRLSGRVCAWCPPRWCRFWMAGATRLGDGWLWLLVAILLPATGRFDLLAAAAVAAALANASVVLLKRRFRRPRPRPHELFGIAAPAHFAFDRFSFPSGHSLNAFALCGVLSPAFPPLAPLFAFVAGSVAASRVVLGLHYLSDVLVGTLVGVLLGGIAYGLVLW
jgi:undecaprenyl-diphosphatase